MPKAAEVDEDVMRAALGVKALREQLAPRVSQRLAAEHHPRDISHQYWAMVEQGKVPGIVKPATQRELLAALTAAGRLDRPLTLEDLAAAVADPGGDSPDARAMRAAASLRNAGPERRAVFPTSDGDVIFSFPADMSPEGFEELQAYFQVFLKANAPKT